MAPTVAWNLGCTVAGTLQLMVEVSRMNQYRSFHRQEHAKAGCDRDEPGWITLGVRQTGTSARVSVFIPVHKHW